MDFMVIEKRKTSIKNNDLSPKEKKSSGNHKDLICTVCGGPATGFNFAVITCMCCKAFFRRNALFGLQALQCRYLSENCNINMKTRRDCSYCRLKKCFEVGMKKELILTDDLKRIKREKILANRQMTLNIIRPIDSLSIKKYHTKLKDIDSNYLTNIYNSYEKYCRVPLILFEQEEDRILSQQPIKARIKIQQYFQYYSQHDVALKTFFKCLPEFRKYSDEQQLVFSKHNMTFLIRISLIETINDQLPLWPGINLLLESIFGKALLDATHELLHSIRYQINDSTCIRLLLIILFYSTNSTYNGDIDSLEIFKIQEKYTELLWLYLKQHYGELTACKNFSLIARFCIHLQAIGHLADLKKQQVQWKNFFLALD